MKLNYKRTLLVGFAFFLIQVFWQAHDATIPVILTNKFGMSQTASGFIMALDNILAVFMLPIFGALSDKCRSKRGKRTPFITIGTTVAAVLLVALSFVDHAQLQNLTDVSAIDDPAALSVIYDQQANTTLQTPEGKEFVLSEVMDKESFITIRSEIVEPSGEKTISQDFTNYVVPARQACAAAATAQQPVPMYLFIGLLLALLIAMSIFRSPAVALMPDVTAKPLRSKANAIINLMGTAGGILVLLLGMIFATSAVKNAMMNYYVYYGIIAALMLGALAIFVLTVREPQWAKEMQEESAHLEAEEVEEAGEKRRLSKQELISMLLILASVALWYVGYNAVTSKYSLYASSVLGMDYNSTMLIAQGAAIVAYLPAGMVASKLGRRKTILSGVVMLATAFAIAAFMRAGSPELLMNVLFALAGIGWATINVNSFPMVVEMCSGADIGKFTGYYYTSSMAAQVITPIFSGYLMDQMGMVVLFPYAALFAGLAFVTMFFVKHGDAKVVAKKGLEVLDIED